MFTGLIRFIIASFVALALGIWSAQNILAPNQAAKVGQWHIWLASNQNGFLPYGLAAHWLSGRLASDSRERLEYMRFVDDADQPLSANCRYRLSGSMPQARWWSLQVKDRTGTAITSDQARLGLDGNLRVIIDRKQAAGNWLRLLDRGPFALVLRFHGPMGELRDDPLAVQLPGIIVERCR